MTVTWTTAPPKDGEYAAYYGTYTALVPSGDVLTVMEQQIVHERCPPPKSVADMGMEFNLVLRILLKTIYVRALETPSQLTQAALVNGRPTS